MSFDVQSINEDIAAQLTRKIYAIPVLIGIGIALYFAWAHEPDLGAPVSITILSIILARTAYIHQDQLWGGIQIAYILTSIAIITIGFIAAGTRAHGVQTPMINAPLGPIGFSGRVQSLEQLEGGKGVRVILTDLHMHDDLPVDQVPHSLRLSIRKGGSDIKTGNRIHVFAKIEPASPPTTPNGFDFRRHAYFNQIGGYGYVLGTPRIYQNDRDQTNPLLLNREDKPHFFSFISTSFLTWFENRRNDISAHVNTTLPIRQAGMVTALLTGERAAITEEDWNALRNSGLAHLLAISGANVDMVALIVFFLARLGMAAFPHFAERHPIKKYAAIIAFMAAFFYVLLILPSTPTLRALLTISIVLLAILLDRSPISLRLVCASATIVLLWQPEQLLSPSFQLSFAAVTALVAVFEILAPWLKRLHQDSTIVRRTVMYILGVCATTAIATIATAPISLYHFQNLALYGVIANVLAVPIMTFLIMPLSILCYILMPFGAADSTLHVVGAANDWILTIAHRTASLPGAQFTPSAIPFAAFIAVVTAGLVLCLGAERLKTLSLIPLSIAAIIMITNIQPNMVILAGGKVVMERREDGTIVTNTRKYARRQQTDWVRYWGGNTDKGAIVDRINPPAPPPGLIIPQTLSPLAIYTPPKTKGINARLKIISPRGHDRLWQAGYE